MLSVDEALERILANFALLPAEMISIRDAFGRVLAEDVHATASLPPFANSSMDGYAVRAADIAAATPNAGAILKVIGDIPAGTAPTFTVGAGQAARIMTGAPLPDGANAVVPVEQTDDPSGRLGVVVPEQITVLKPVRLGDYVRPVGEDWRQGEVMLTAGRILRAADLGVLAGMGVPRVAVIRRPKIAILSTGDEVLDADQPLTPGKIRDMNSYALNGLIQELGAESLVLGIAHDTVEDVHRKLAIAIESKADLIVSSAGVSVGAYDVVKSVVDSLGGLNFWKVNVRPGKPLAFGQVRNIPFIGLPGNPVSALVTFDVFARPAILKMMGKPLNIAIVEAEAGEQIPSDGRQSYIRVTLTRSGDRLIARPTGTQSSGALSSLVRADGLLIIPAGVTHVAPGTRLQVRLYGN
jgi:molybdopterin molybdotransferase